MEATQEMMVAWTRECGETLDSSDTLKGNRVTMHVILKEPPISHFSPHCDKIQDKGRKWLILVHSWRGQPITMGETPCTYFSVCAWGGWWYECMLACACICGRQKSTTCVFLCDIPLYSLRQSLTEFRACCLGLGMTGQ